MPFRTYVTVTGLVKTYEYHWKRSEAKRRPKCPRCGNALNKLSYKEMKTIKTAGWICPNNLCRQIYIPEKHKVFKVKVFHGDDDL